MPSVYKPNNRPNLSLMLSKGFLQFLIDQTFKNDILKVYRRRCVGTCYFLMLKLKKLSPDEPDHEF